MMRRLIALSIVILLWFATFLPLGVADERLKGIACRSVHLSYPAPEGIAFYNEMTIRKSADGTYFMACGFSAGYYGLQELANGKKVLLFSVWDPGSQNDPKKVKQEQRVKLLFKDKQVRVGRFGGEGTGGQSFLDLDWKVGETYRFLVKAKPDGKWVAYSAYLGVPGKKEWRHLVTFSTLATKGKQLRGYYSFVEDFRRNRISTTKVRQAEFGNGWVQTPDGKWIPLTRARFTADSNPVLNIDAGITGKVFYLTTGGETKNTGTKLGKTVDRPSSSKTPPEM